MKMLRKHDPRLVELQSGDGGVLVSPGLKGRVFCHIGGELVHRLDVERLEHPLPTEFNNLGGNSLWPAPEGGAYAFNYPPGSNEWRVPAGVDQADWNVTSQSASTVSLEKEVVLTNRKGVDVRVKFQRNLASVQPDELIDGFTLDAAAYSCVDVLVPQGEYRQDDVLIAPWSLEQFPGAEGITAFGKVDNAADAINADFYGDPKERLSFDSHSFFFTLGGEERHQIGVKAAHRPEMIGALDPGRFLLVLRRTPMQEGVYFNMADNDQPGGPFSAADMYSIFNGGALNFFELETVAPMQVKDGLVAASRLVSETLLLKGSVNELRRYLAEREGIVL